MIITLLSCDAAKPDRRAIAKTIEEISTLSAADAREQADFLLEGSEIEIEISGPTSSAFRALRKLDIDYSLEE